MEQLAEGNTEKGHFSFPTGITKRCPFATQVWLPSNSCSCSTLEQIYIGSFKFSFLPSPHIFSLLSVSIAFLLPFVIPSSFLSSVTQSQWDRASRAHRSSSVFWHCQYCGKGQINSAALVPRKKKMEEVNSSESWFVSFKGHFAQPLNSENTSELLQLV